jgi:hypothetical protein
MNISSPNDFMAVLGNLFGGSGGASGGPMQSVGGMGTSNPSPSGMPTGGMGGSPQEALQKLMAMFQGGGQGFGIPGGANNQPGVGSVASTGSGVVGGGASTNLPIYSTPGATPISTLPMQMGGQAAPGGSLANGTTPIAQPGGSLANGITPVAQPGGIQALMAMLNKGTMGLG